MEFEFVEINTSARQMVMFYNLQDADVLSLSLTLVLTENGKWSTDSTALDRGDVEFENLS